MIAILSKRLCLFSNQKKIITKFINYKPGPPENMFVDQRQIEVRPGQQLLKIKSIGINRAECLHREGKYKINRPVQSYLGLEAAGEVYDPHSNKKLFDGIALLTGGSYAEWASLPSSHILPLPSKLSYVEGAAIPEAWITAFQLLRLAQVKSDQDVVIYAGASGVGTAAIQLCKLLGARAWAVVSTADKGRICQQVGASGIVYYKDNKNWAKELISLKKGHFEAVLDCVGPNNIDSTLELLQIDGKWILFGLLSGAKANFNLAGVISKRISLISTTLKTRTDQYKTELIKDFHRTALPSFDNGKLKPIIYRHDICDWTSAQAFVDAHKMMESNTNAGKIILEFKQSKTP